MKAQTIFKRWRMFSAFLILALLAGSAGYLPAKAQSQLSFEGIIAYEDSTGNIILATGDGKRVPVTTDGDAGQNPLERNQKPTYEIFGFSPNGAYLAFTRWSSDEGDRLYIYDVASGNIAAKLNFSEHSRYNPMQWHRDSDSIIAHQSLTEETGVENTSYDHEYYYRVYFSGERVLLLDTYSHRNKININFDLDTFFEFNERNSNPGFGGILHNWAENTTHEVQIADVSVQGVWTRDGSYFIHVDNEHGEILIIDLKTGITTAQISIPNEMWALEDFFWQDPYNFFLLSPDSKHLLLTDENAGLYDLNLETSAVESVYAWPVNNPENEIKALWSGSGNLVMVNTYSADDQRVLVVKKGNLPVRVATSAEPLFWLSKDSERLVYAQYNVGGDKINGDLMVYDHATGASVKIGDLPIFKDVDTSSGISYGYYLDSVDWTNGEVDLPEAPPTPDITPEITPSTASICPDAAPVQPIMLVVGWGGSEGSPGLSKETNEFAVYTRDFFAQHGYAPECNIFYATGTSPNKSQKENAREIQRSLCAAYDALKEYRPDWNGHFDMIGHSYGGLRSRAYLEDPNLYGLCIVNGTMEKVIKVDNLFTLGSPHGGEPYNGELLPLASLIIGVDVWTGITTPAPVFSPAAQQMFPPVRQWINMTSRQPDDVNYYLIIGNAEKDAWAQVAQILNINILSSILLISPSLPSLRYYDSDLAVHQSSSLILGTSVLLKSRYPNVRTSVTHDWHGWDPSGRRLIPIFSPPTYYSDSETLAREVLPYIGKTETPSGGGGGGSWMVLPIDMQNKIMANATPISITQQEPQTYAPQLNIHIGDGILSPGQSQQFEFNVSQAESLGITLVTSNKNLQLQLIQPDGQSISKDAPGIQYQEFSLEGSNLKGYQINNMLAGKWIVSVDGTASSEESSFVVSATPSTPIVLQPILPEWRPNQNSVEISTKVSIENTPVIGGALSVLVIRPDGSSHPLDLFDDGIHQDGGANDGIYGNAFSQTEIGGVYRAFFTATGSFNNQTFTRNAIGYFVIAPSTAKFVDPFSDSGIDENNDGSYEYLEIQTPLTVAQAGNYVISGDLYAGDIFIAPATIRQSFEAGSQIAKMRFDGEAIYASQKDGAYTVRNILLLDETEIPLLIEERPPYTTAVYPYRDFGPKDLGLPKITSSTTLFVAGGFGLLCLAFLAIGGVFVYIRTRKPKRVPAKSVNRPQAIKPVSDSETQIKKAIELSKSKRHQEAFEILRAIVQAQPNNMSAWFNLGGVLASMGKYKDAERCYSRAKQLGHPRGEDALSWLKQRRK
ncbi:MAG: hypothetical protein DPW15_02975 [Chloroflexi bacterium]|nr:hypothetical protein [Chloroflexota bacterium]